jgi:hypothetical protein
MEIGEKVTIQILGLDILTSQYGSNNDCALAKATKRHFNTNNVCAGGRTINVGKKDFEIDHNKFNNKIFKELKETIIQPNEVVIEVELTYYADLEF